MKYDIDGYQVWAVDHYGIIEKLFSAYIGNLRISTDWDKAGDCKRALGKVFGFHNIDNPAIIFPNGNKEWWTDGELHRTDGPAMKHYDKLEWWIKGSRIRIPKTFQILSDLTNTEMMTMIIKYGKVS